MALLQPARSLSRLVVSPRASLPLCQSRNFASGGDTHHGSSKVNFWEDPLSPSKWKEEHFVLISIAGWGLLFYGGYKFFSGMKKEGKTTQVENQH
eukprot:c6115_g1_i1 orf=150-434(+)